MKLNLRFLITLPLAIALGCSDDDDNQQPAPAGNIVEVAAGSAELSTLVELVTAADLADALKDTGPFTVFAPRNAAFAKIPEADLEALKNDKEALRRVLQYHVVSGAVRAEQVVTLSSADTEAGESVSIRVDGATVILTDGQGNDSKVVRTDVEASNGIVHVIDTVLLPPIEVEEPGNIVEVAQAAGFSTLISAAQSAGLADALQGAGPFTVFAPTNDAFAALGSAVPSDPDLLANVLLHHVIADELDSTAVAGNGPFTTMANTQLEVDESGSPITINGFALSQIIDVEASNGIVHIMDDVIVPPTILEAAGANADLSTLVTAVGAASSGVQSALGSQGPITVFAPANSAFAEIPEADLNALLADQAALDDVLQYHVASGQVLSSDLSNGQTITMANGDSLTVRINGSDISFEDGTGATIGIVAADIRLLNGVVHVVDAAMYPAVEGPGNIVQVASDVGNFSSLLGAAAAAGLAETLANDGPYTVFAPTDAAFSALGVDLSPVMPSVIANILLHHVVPGALESGDVVSGSPLASAANTALDVDASGSPITINGFELSDALDVEASNGIIHVMNEVIVPPTIVEVAAATADLSSLVAAVGGASQGLQEALAPNTLAGETPITVFAPTNAAFTASGIDLNTVGQDVLDEVLKHHVVGAQATSSDLNDGQVIDTYNDQITVNIDGSGNVSITDGQGNTANVIATLKDIRTLTGVVHVIDRVMLPRGDIVEVATEAGSFGTLLGAATAVGLADTLANDGPYSVFAPTDAAFTALGIDLGPVSSDVIANILLYHVANGRLESSEVVGSSAIGSLANLSLAVDTSGSPITIGGSDLSATLDVGAANGIIHVMDEVIVPPTIVEAAQATSDLSTLVSAIDLASAGVRGALAPSTLTGEDPITVFAPTNAAFMAAGIDVGSTDQATLDAVLAHHVVGAQAVSSSLSDGQTVTTLNGDLTIDIDNSGNITVTDGQGGTANVIKSLRDIRTLTGVVHVIDAVLLP